MTIEISNPLRPAARLLVALYIYPGWRALLCCSLASLREASRGNESPADSNAEINEINEIDDPDDSHHFPRYSAARFLALSHR